MSLLQVEIMANNENKDLFQQNYSNPKENPSFIDRAWAIFRLAK